MPAPSAELLLPVKDYDLGITLASGQAFRWTQQRGEWIGIIDSKWVSLIQSPHAIRARAVQPVTDWMWLTSYLQTDVSLRDVARTFPMDDKHLAEAVQACSGLRLLRQDHWECLASFILSSTKQIPHIQQIIAILSERYGERLLVPEGYPPAFGFPSSARIAALSEQELRECKMGFRAPYLRETAHMLERGEVDLARLEQLPTTEARAALVTLPGVGRKIADCVLLFSYGFQDAFPIDVWIKRALEQFYFRGRTIKMEKLERFSAKHFGPYAGYAQQYLFHYVRTVKGRARATKP